MTDENDDTLMHAAGELVTEISPERDLWPGIAAAIAVLAARRPQPWLAQAAAIVLLVGASSAVTYKLTATDSEIGHSVVNADMIFEQASFGNRYSLGPGFQDARMSLVDELDVELERLSPEARSDIETNLKLIHDAIFEMNKALEDEPDNVMLQDRVLQAYRSELALLRRISGLSRNVMLRNDI